MLSSKACRDGADLGGDAQPGAWDGPLSRELLVFNSFLRATSRSMRNLLEAIAVNCLLRSDAQRSYADYLGVAFSLPFQADTNTGMGILFKAFGDTVCHMAGGIETVAKTANGGATKDEREAIQQQKAQVLDLLQNAFPNVKNVRAELERGFRFWNLVSPNFFRSLPPRRAPTHPACVARDTCRSCSRCARFASPQPVRRSRPTSQTASRRQTSGCSRSTCNKRSRRSIATHSARWPLDAPSTIHRETRQALPLLRTRARSSRTRAWRRP